jgi:hypothetical protein
MNIFIIITLISFSLGIYFFINSIKIQGIVLKTFRHNKDRIISYYEYKPNFFHKPNWSILFNCLEKSGSDKAPFIIGKIAYYLNSDIALVLKSNKNNSEDYRIKDNWYYPNTTEIFTVILKKGSNFIKTVKKNKVLVLDSLLKDKIPLPLIRIGVNSLIAVNLNRKNENILLIVCNCKKKHGKPPYQISYTMADAELAKVIASLI